MKVTKPVDMQALEQELRTAGVPFNVLGSRLTLSEVPNEREIFNYGDDGLPAELPPEAEPVLAAHDGTKKDKTATFEAAEDAERLQIVRDRAAEDPAFAALADLTLGKQGV